MCGLRAVINSAGKQFIGACIPFTCYPGPRLLRPYALVWDPSLGSVSAQVITAPLASVFQWAQFQFQFYHTCSVAKQSQVQVREDTPHFQELNVASGPFPEEEETLNYFKCCTVARSLRLPTFNVLFSNRDFYNQPERIKIESYSPVSTDTSTKHSFT